MTYKTKTSKIIKKIDALYKKCQKLSSKETTTIGKEFLKILEKISNLHPDDDIACLAYLIPTSEKILHINSTDTRERLTKDGKTISKIIEQKKLPLYIDCKNDDINLKTRTGFFLGIPIINQMMDIEGSIILYSKTNKELKTLEDPVTAIAISISNVIRHKSFPLIQKNTSSSKDSSKDKKTKAKASNKFRKDTASYRKDKKQTAHYYTQRSTHIMGIAFGDGMGMGQAVVHGMPPDIKSFSSSKTQEEEESTLKQSIKSVDNNITETLETHIRHLSPEAIDCLEMHKLLLQDRMWTDQIYSGIKMGLSVDAAIEYARQKAFFSLFTIPDPYIRERFADIADLSDKLRLSLTTEEQEDGKTKDIIIVAHNLGVSSLMEYDMKEVRGIILETGSISSHIAIIASTMNIPILGQCTDAIQYIHPSDQIIIDCDQSVAFCSPEPHTLRLYRQKKEQIRQRERYRSLVMKNQKPQIKTKDGVEVSLQLNAGLLSEVSLMKEYNADGIGLFRTELTFMGWTKYPSVAKQTELYQKVIDQIDDDKNVVFRTLDIGGDKPLPYFDAPEEENPALGWRAIRIGIDRPAVLRTQITAFLKAASKLQRPLHIMVPLVSEIAEITHVRNMMHMTTLRLEKMGIKLPPEIKLGVMLEVPSLLWQLDELCHAVDFISVGTNDLMQYMFAADRGSAMLHHRYDILSPAMLKALKHIIDTCNKHKTPVTICGEAASNPMEAMALITMGYRNLSMPGTKIPLIRNMCQSLDTEALSPYLERVMRSTEHSIRSELQSFARDHQINII